jgi:hypothetical protein
MTHPLDDEPGLPEFPENPTGSVDDRRCRWAGLQAREADRWLG